MSVYFDLFCRDCKCGCGFHWNHGEDDLLEIWKFKEGWALLAGLGDNPRASGQFWLNFVGNESGGRDLPAFAAAHKDHDVLPRDEYGRFSDRCGEFFRCGECQTNHACGLPKDHPPPHKRA